MLKTKQVASNFLDQSKRHEWTIEERTGYFKVYHMMATCVDIFRIPFRGKVFIFFLPSKIFFSSIKKNIQMLQLEHVCPKAYNFSYTIIYSNPKTKIRLCKRCWSLLLHSAMIHWYSRKVPWKLIVPLRSLS